MFEVPFFTCAEASMLRQCQRSVQSCSEASLAVALLNFTSVTNVYLRPCHHFLLIYLNLPSMSWVSVYFSAIVGSISAYFFFLTKIHAQREWTSSWTLSIIRQSFYVNSRPGIKGYTVILTFHLELIYSPGRKLQCLPGVFFRFPRSCPMHAYL